MGVIDVGVGSRGSDKRDDDRLISSSTDVEPVNENDTLGYKKLV